MGGGLMQLVAYGAQDIYLTGNPQITFFKVVYRRHTNFSMETISQSMDGNATMDDSANEASCTIARNGDLIHKMYIAVLSGSSTGIKYGSAIVQSAELEIGGQKIDKHTTEWNHIWNELTTPDSKNIGLKAMQSDSGIGASTSADSVSVGMVQVPLNFYFCRNPGLALPLIALQYHEVKINFVFGISGVTGATSGTPIKFYVDYIYLDTDERRRFAQVSHEYLIEQVQIQTMSTDTVQELTFNHPVKELIWTHAENYEYTTAILKLNGLDRFEKQEKEYFQLRQPFDYHTTVPKMNLPKNARGTEPHMEANLLTKTVTLGELDPYSGAITSGQFNIVAEAAATTNTSTFGSGDGTALYAFNLTDLPVDRFITGDLLLFIGSGTNFGPHTEVPNSLEVEVSTGTDDGTAASIPATVNSGNTYFELQMDIFKTGSGTPPELNSGDDGNGSMITITGIHKMSKGHGLASSYTSSFAKRINVYSFALKPEEHQPSGTCNFSRIDTAILEFASAPGSSDIGNIYAVNYNVLRIMSGMGGLAYSN